MTTRAWARDLFVSDQGNHYRDMNNGALAFREAWCYDTIGGISNEKNFVATLLFSMTACTSDKIDEQILGTWYQRGPQAWDYEWYFGDDGKVTLTFPESSASVMEYITQDNQLTMDPNGFSTVYSYKFGYDDSYEYLFLYDSYGGLKVTLRR